MDDICRKCARPNANRDNKCIYYPCVCFSCPDELIESYKSQLDNYGYEYLPDAIIDLIIRFIMHHIQSENKYCHLVCYTSLRGIVYFAKLVYIKIYENQEYGVFRWLGWISLYDEAISMNSLRILKFDIDSEDCTCGISVCTLEEYPFEYQADIKKIREEIYKRALLIAHG